MALALTASSFSPAVEATEEVIGFCEAYAPCPTTYEPVCASICKTYYN